MACLVLLGTVISSYLIPFVKSKISAQELEKLSGFILMAVRAAEQIYSSDQNQQKKKYVTEYIKGLIGTKLKIDLSDEQLDAIIEGTVNEVKKGLSSFQA